MSEAVVDVNSLLAPIEGEYPAGTDLRADESANSRLRQIKDLRETARRREKQIELEEAEAEEKEGRQPNAPALRFSKSIEPWKKLRVLATETLREESKDLEVAAYLIEALLRVEGFAGLGDGLRLARGLVEGYWDVADPDNPGLYPRPDEDGLETTVLPLQRLDGEVLAAVIRQIPITDDANVGPFVAWQYRQAGELSRCTPDERQVRIDRGAATREMFDRAARETSAEFFRETNRKLTDCRQELELLTQSLNERCPQHSPTFSAVEDALREVQDVVKAIAGPKLQEMSAGSDGVQSDGEPLGNHLVDNSVSRREDAFRMLENIAAFFERTEPQSLIPAQLRKVVRWGRLSPAQLYMELIEDSSVREQIFKQVGIAEQKDDSSESSDS